LALMFSTELSAAPPSEALLRQTSHLAAADRLLFRKGSVDWPLELTPE